MKIQIFINSVSIKKRDGGANLTNSQMLKLSSPNHTASSKPPQKSGIMESRLEFIVQIFLFAI